IEIGRVDRLVTMGLRIRSVPLAAACETEVELRSKRDQRHDRGGQRPVTPASSAVRGSQVWLPKAGDLKDQFYCAGRISLWFCSFFSNDSALATARSSLIS